MTIHNKQKTISLLSLMLLSSIVSTQATSNSEEVTSTGQEERSNRERQTVTGVTKPDKSVFTVKKSLYHIASFVVTVIAGIALYTLVLSYPLYRSLGTGAEIFCLFTSNNPLKTFTFSSMVICSVILVIRLTALFDFLTFRLLNYDSPLDEQKQESL